MDVHTKKQRSYNMSRIRSKNTGPEKLLFNLLSNHKISYRKHGKLPGKPDAVLIRQKLAVFVDGEFWHGKDFEKWKNKLQPFWHEKISVNRARDRKVDRLLRKQGWHILHFWESDLKKRPDACFLRIKRYIRLNKASV